MTPARAAAATELLDDWLTAWHAGRRRPLVMGILNITPDSFSDGGQFLEKSAAVRRASEMIDDGADIIDVGGESTRPGAADVPADEQMRRVIPAIEAIRANHADVPISIDTRSAAVALAAIDAGATLVNDVSAMRDDPAMVDVVASRGVPVVLMHMQGTPATMQNAPQYDDVVQEVVAFLASRMAAAEKVGVDRRRILVDPGIGFGKTVDHNLALLRNLSAFASLGAPLLVGASRKRFIRAVLGGDDDNRTRLGTAAATAIACVNGADVLRVHDAAAMRVVVDLAAAVREGRPG